MTDCKGNKTVYVYDGQENAVCSIDVISLKEYNYSHNTWGKITEVTTMM